MDIEHKPMNMGTQLINIIIILEFECWNLLDLNLFYILEIKTKIEYPFFHNISLKL